jgi:hypothetical protein
LKTRGTFARTAELYREFDLLSKKINETISLVDPSFFSALSQLSEVSKAKHSSLAVWASIDPLLMEGRELLFNHRSGMDRVQNMGMRRDMAQRISLARVDDLERRSLIKVAQEIIYVKDYKTDSKAVEDLLRQDSLVPTAASVYCAL